jgi:hypothetical protein
MFACREKDAREKDAGTLLYWYNDKHEQAVRAAPATGSPRQLLRLYLALEGMPAVAQGQSECSSPRHSPRDWSRISPILARPLSQ